MYSLYTVDCGKNKLQNILVGSFGEMCNMRASSGFMLTEKLTNYNFSRSNQYNSEIYKKNH